MSSVNSAYVYMRWLIKGGMFIGGTKYLIARIHLSANNVCNMTKSLVTLQRSRCRLPTEKRVFQVRYRNDNMSNSTSYEICRHWCLFVNISVLFRWRGIIADNVQGIVIGTGTITWLPLYQLIQGEVYGCNRLLSNQNITRHSRILYIYSACLW